jgi:hypothetical protein
VVAEIQEVRSGESQRSKTNGYRHHTQRYSGDCDSTVVGFAARDARPRGQAHRQRGNAEQDANDKPASNEGNHAKD